MQTLTVPELDLSLDNDTVRVSKGKTGYGHRAPWNTEEKKALKNAFQLGVTIPALAQSHHRSPNAILTQLCKMRCITHAQRLILATTMHLDMSVPDANTYMDINDVDIEFSF